MDVGVSFEAVGASSCVLIATFFPVMVFSTVRTLLVLAELKVVAEAEALKSPGNYDKVEPCTCSSGVLFS